jgi:serine/threonine-protein kinase
MPINPAELSPLENGSYLLEFIRRGYPLARYPVRTQRDTPVEIRQIDFFTEGQIGEGYVQVPGSQFVWGADPQVKGSGKHATSRILKEAPNFFIARDPITIGRYLDFLNDPAEHLPEEALYRVPRTHPQGGFLLRPNEMGVFELPQGRFYGAIWHPDLPVTSISYQDGFAFLDWLSRQDQRRYMFPTPEQFQKAARGVDGRFFPWGDVHHPCFSNTNRSHPSGGMLVPISSERFSVDVSIYGVRGLAGNAATFLHTPSEEGQFYAGGTWDEGPIEARSAAIKRIPRGFIDPGVGIRPVTMQPLRIR